MKFFKNRGDGARAVQTAPRPSPLWELERRAPLATGEQRLYAALRESVPIISAALEKIERLIGSFEVRCPDPAAEQMMRDFLQGVRVNAAQNGIQSFLNSYLDQLLLYGTAVGEIVPSADGAEIAGLYNACLDDLEIRRGDSPFSVQICRREESGGAVPVRRPGLILFSALNPEPGQAHGVSILRGLPFIGNILMKIYGTIGVNWDRVGNARFAVTYKPSGGTDAAYAGERARQIAAEWGRAMQGGTEVSDFVAVGDVDIRVIGADNQILDSEIPVRQMLEQIVAKLGVPPFLLGLSWSSTERMSSQQADLLTSELEAYRRILNPAVRRICGLWLRMNGFDQPFDIEWENISLQDELDLAAARLKNAQAAKIEREIGKGKE